MKIFLDDQGLDIRASWVPNGYKVVTNPSDFRLLIETIIAQNEVLEAISFDNDLGFPEEGKHLLRWLYTEHPELLLRNPTMDLKVHSQNNVASEQIRTEIVYFRENLQSLIQQKASAGVSYEDIFSGSI
jgi:hypothetical protein